MKKLFIFSIILLIMGTFSHISFALSDEDKEAYEDGTSMGEITGELYGQKDSINNRRSDWEKAYKNEEKNITNDYNLDRENSSYRINFKDGFKEGFKEGYERGYRNLKVDSDSKKTTQELGLEHGKLFGAMLGDADGRKDFYLGRTNDWRRNIPSDTMIKNEYSLENDTREYSDSFIEGYKAAYEENYSYAFRVSNVDNEKLSKENGIIHGREIGEKMGEANGKIDYDENKINNWRSALPSDEEIIHKFHLFSEASQYRVGFLSGFKDGFNKGYTQAFQSENVNKAKGNMNYSKISMEGAVITSPDQNVTLSIESGTFYQETYFSLMKGDHYLNQSYEPVTSIYEIQVENNLNSINLKKPIILSFKYYGTETGGIYQLVDDEWRYLYSTIDNNTITTQIPATTYNGGKYAVLIDDHYQELTDVHSNWAGEEIYSFIRRNYISGYTDNTFRPEKYVTRGEFVTLLGRVSKWNYPVTNTNLNQFKDAKSFGVYADSIQNAVSRGYIQGYPDSTFRPNNLITYQEIEWIVQKFSRNEHFNWDNIAEKMIYEKYTRSRSRYGKNQYITRAEVVYMLYVLQQKNIL